MAGGDPQRSRGDAAHRGPRDEPTNRRWVAANVDHWEQHGFGQWTLWSHDGEPVGRGGLRTIHPCVDEDIVEVGYTLARAAWGKGYATEAARAFVEIGFDQYDLPELGAITLLTNESSARVLEKVGFVAERTVTRDIGPHRFWRLQTPGKAAYSS